MASDSTDCRVLCISVAVVISLYSYGSALSFLFFSPPGRVGLVRAVYLLLVQPHSLPDGTAW